MQLEDETMTSAYKPPDPKKTLSARVPTSIHERIAAIQRIWQERAKAAGHVASEIDATFVLIALLAKATDEELAQWGGMPASEESWRRVLAEIRAVAKQQ